LSNLTRKQDIAKAKELLKAAGQQNLTVELTVSDLVPGELEAATLYAAQAKKAGVTVNLKKVDAASYFTAAAGWPYPMGVTTWSDAANSLGGFYQLGGTTKGPYNETRWGNADTDAKIQEALGTSDPKRATELWSNIQKRMFANGGYIVYGAPQFVDGLSPKVQGLTNDQHWFLSGAQLYKAWLAK
jgi:peptide/nickel transport system substrate-binding protein